MLGAIGVRLIYVLFPNTYWVIKVEEVVEALPRHYAVLRNRVIESLNEAIESLTQIDAEMEKINKQIEDLSSNIRYGYLEYKWVLNKIKQKYWYWYLRKRENGKLRSIYIGKHIPKHLIEGINNRRQLESLAKRLEELDEEKERKIQHIYNAIRELQKASITL